MDMVVTVTAAGHRACMFGLAGVWSVVLRLTADPGQRRGCMKIRSVTENQHVGAEKGFLSDHPRCHRKNYTFTVNQVALERDTQKTILISVT